MLWIFNLKNYVDVLVVVRVWNEAAAHRLTTMGHSVRRGDLVWLRQGQNKMEDARETSMAQVRRQIKQEKEIF